MRNGPADANLPAVQGERVIGTELDPLATACELAREYALHEKAPATRRAYRSDIRHFAAWCGDQGLCPLPATGATVAAYLAALADAGKKASTIVRRAAAIRYFHKLKELEPPTNLEAVRAVVRGIKRKIGTAPNRKAPATAEAVTAMAEKIPDTLQGKRDRAILLLGFAAAMRRSEIVALDAADIERTAEGICITIRRSKTDQEGEGYVISVPRGTKLRPAQALDAWLTAAAIEDGPIFRPIGKGGAIRVARLTDRSVATIVKRYALAAGFDAEMFSGHSLRAGFVTSALEAGADVLKVMDVTRHRELRTLKVYDRRARGFKNHAGKGFL